MSHVGNDPAVLTSWKEIASYLGKGVRTVQRWESDLGLPVRRPSENSRIVHASRAELDAWLAKWAQRAKPGNGASPDNDGASSTRSIMKECNAGLKEAQALRQHQRQLTAGMLDSMHRLADTCRTLAGYATRASKRLGEPPNRN